MDNQEVLPLFIFAIDLSCFLGRTRNSTPFSIAAATAWLTWRSPITAISTARPYERTTRCSCTCMNVLLQRTNAEKEPVLPQIEDQIDRSPVRLSDDRYIRSFRLLQRSCETSSLVDLKSKLAIHREAFIRTLINHCRELFEGAVE